MNNHFSDPGSSEKHSGPRKSTESGDTARKRLKRAGVRLKFRQLPFSARIFDFFDAGAMAGIQHRYNLGRTRIFFYVYPRSSLDGRALCRQPQGADNSRDLDTAE